MLDAIDLCHKYPNGIGREEEYEEYEKRNNSTFVNKVKKHTFYPSNKPDTFIKNAITGVAYPWKVGSIDSKRLFKVVDTLGLYDSDGCRIGGRKKRSDTLTVNPNPNHLYYDTPEEFMRHRKCTVQPELIESWLKTKTELFPV